MEIQKYKQIEEIVKALGEDFKPVFDEVEALNKILENLRAEKGNPLIELVSRITKTARRHDIDTLVDLQGTNHTIGTNHNGLGFQEKYSKQLSDLALQYNGNSSYRERIVRDILFNSDAVIDLTAVIKKSNQKTFLKTIKILKKYKLGIPFNNFIKDNIDTINVDFGKPNYKIIVELNYRNDLRFSIEKGEEEIRDFVVGLTKGKPEFRFVDDKNSLFKEISNKNIQGVSVDDIKLGFFLSQHKEVIIKEIKAKKGLLKSVLDGYKKERKELNDLLEPFLTLEKL